MWKRGSTWLTPDACWMLVIQIMILPIHKSSSMQSTFNQLSFLHGHPPVGVHSRLMIPGVQLNRVRRGSHGIPGEASPDSARYIIGSSPTSQPILFFDDWDTESHVVRNSMLIVKKKPPKDSPSQYENYSQINSGYQDSILRIPTYHRPTTWTSTTNRPLGDHLWGSDEITMATVSKNHHKPSPWVAENFGSVWRRTTQSAGIINNHHPGSYIKPKPTTPPPKYVSTSGIKVAEVVWQSPTTKLPVSGVISNHMSSSGGTSTWKKPMRPDASSGKLPFQRWKHRISSTTAKTTTTMKPKLTAMFTKKPDMPSDHALISMSHSVKKPLFQVTDEDIQVNNHKTLDIPMRRKPQTSMRPHEVPTGAVAIADKHKEMAVDLLGGRLKLPETVTSKPMTVLDAPSDRLTTVKHNKIIVIQKRMDSYPQITTNDLLFDQATTAVVTSKPFLTLTTKKAKKATSTTKMPSKSSKPSDVQSTFPVAPVMDPWDHIPIPSAPSWVKPTPTKGQSLSTSSFPGIPFLPFLSSLISPLMSKPLTPEAVNTGIQGIKAMQGFIRNSLMGAMLCFLPSALIAMRLSATQRELRKTPEMDEMVTFCKKCLENLKSVKKMAKQDQPDWTKKL